MGIGVQAAFRVFVVAASASGAAAQVPSAETFRPTGDVSITPSYNMSQSPGSATMVSTQPLSPVMAEKCIRQEIDASGSEALLPPRVDHIGVRATLLHWGMSRDDVDRIMGAPEQIDTSSGEGRDVHILKYPAEPIATTVTIIDDRLSGVALDIAGIDDRALPTFSRTAWLGMSRTTVLQMLGTPADDRVRDGHGMTVEQMIFARPNAPDVSIFVIDGRVAAKKVGRSFPSDILGFALPLAPDPADDEIDDVAVWPKERPVGVGMAASELPVLFGAPKHQVSYTFKGRPATYAIYETNPGRSWGRFAFIDGVFTEFADGRATPLGQIRDGR
jgi:hypothetical protein